MSGQRPSPLEDWRWSARAWEASRRLTRSRIDLLLRLRSAAGLPLGRARFRAMGLPDAAVADALRRVRALSDWDAAWTWTAQQFLGEARRSAGEGAETEAALARRRAALCYHTAHFLAFDDPRKVRALRASSTTLFAQTVPVLLPDAIRVDSAWRATTLPGYLLRPEVGSGATPLAVLLNGTTTAKEELLHWSAPFLRAGLAVLALDWPGTGEAAQSTRLTPDCEDLTDGIVAMAKADPTLDERRIALVGFSLGGALAVHAAAHDRRVAAVVAVTPPFDPSRWLASANPLLLEQLAAAAGGADALAGLAEGFALVEVAPRLRCPLLVLGAGRDLVVPAAESVRLAAAVGEDATLLWFGRGAHGLYEAVADWTEDAARWLRTVLTPDEPVIKSTRVDPFAALAETLPTDAVSELQPSLATDFS